MEPLAPTFSDVRAEGGHLRRGRASARRAGIRSEGEHPRGGRSAAHFFLSFFKLTHPPSDRAENHPLAPPGCKKEVPLVLLNTGS
jgi:hypothetical protein